MRVITNSSGKLSVLSLSQGKVEVRADEAPEAVPVAVEDADLEAVDAALQ